jgi:hypothetical protein
MDKKDSPGCLIGPLASAWRWLDRRVKDAHPNWMQIVGWLVAAIAAFAVAWYFFPGTEGPRPQTPPRAVADSTNETESQLLEGNAQAEVAHEVPPVPAKSDATAALGTRSCDADYAADKKYEFTKLIEAKVQECVQFFGDSIELYYSCDVEDGVYEVMLKYQVSGIINKEQLPFSAEYRGVRDIDLTQVNVTPLTPTFRNLCRRKAEADSRRPG